MNILRNNHAEVRKTNYRKNVLEILILFIFLCILYIYLANAYCRSLSRQHPALPGRCLLTSLTLPSSSIALIRLRIHIHSNRRLKRRLQRRRFIFYCSSNQSSFFPNLAKTKPSSVSNANTEQSEELQRRTTVYYWS